MLLFIWLDLKPGLSLYMELAPLLPWNPLVLKSCDGPWKLAENWLLFMWLLNMLVKLVRKAGELKFKLLKLFALSWLLDISWVNIFWNMIGSKWGRLEPIDWMYWLMKFCMATGSEI